MLPVTTIGGYLGSGKTTLVNHLLRNNGGLRLAILVNEFGELPIDEDLIESQDEDVISIAGGCICCSYGNDMMAALGDLSEMAAPPDHVLIEASGVAIPSAILAAVGLLDGFRGDGIVVVADAETVQKLAKDDYVGDTIERQLIDADLVILNKIDLVTDEAKAATISWLSSSAPSASVVPAERGQVPIDLVLGAVQEGRQYLAETNHQGSSFESFVLKPHGDLSAEKLAEQLAIGGYGVVRAKGFVTEKDGMRKLIHVVGQRWQASPTADENEPAVVCIGLKQQLKRAEIESFASKI